MCDVKGDKGAESPAGAAKGAESRAANAVPSEQKDLGEPQIDDKASPPADPAQKEELQQKRQEFLKKLEEQRRQRGNFDEKEFQKFVEQNGDKLIPPDPAGQKGRPPFVPKENFQEPPTAKNSDPRHNEATTLQLQQFMDAVEKDRKTLEKAGITEEQWREFVKNYADLAKREEANKDTPAAPQNTGRLGGIGGVRENPGAASDPNDPRGAGRTQPPPGYRDALLQFMKELNSAGDKK